MGAVARAEGGRLPDPVVMCTELALWFTAFLCFVVAEVGLVTRRDGVRPLMAVAVTGFITIGLILLQPPPWADGLAVVGMFVGSWWLYRRPAFTPFPARTALEGFRRKEALK